MYIPCPLYGGTCEINHPIHISWLYVLESAGLVLVPLNMKSSVDDLDVHEVISPLVLHFGVEDQQYQVEPI
jgi:hypothetical protein